MKLDGAVIDYMYERHFLFKTVVYSLKRHFNIQSTMAAQSFYAFIDKNGGLREEFEEAEIEAFFNKWTASCPIPNPSDFEYYSMRLNNTLAHFYGLQMTVEEDEKKDRIITAISSGNEYPLVLGLALVISCYHRLLSLWRRFQLRKHITEGFNYSERLTRARIRVLSTEARIVDTLKKVDEETAEFILNGPFSRLLSPWLRDFLSLYYGKGYVFDDNNVADCAYAMQHLVSIGFILEYNRGETESIQERMANTGIKTDDKFFNAQVFLQSNRLSSEREDVKYGSIEQINTPKVSAGRKPGCWLVSDKLNEEAIWREVIQSSIWSNVMNELATFEFPGFTPKKIQSAQVLLAAAMIYRGAEEKGIAKGFDNGVRQSFKRTLSFVKFNEDILPDYMRLLNTWRSIQKKKHEISTLSNDRVVMEDFEYRETGRMIKAAFEREIYLQYERTDPQLCRVLKANSDRIGNVLSLIKKKLERGAYLSHTLKKEVDE